MALIDVLHSAVVGMRSAAADAAAAARDITDPGVSTAGYRSDRSPAQQQQDFTRRESLPLQRGGVAGVRDVVLPKETVVAAGEDAHAESFGVDPEYAFTRLTLARNAYSASIELARTADEMTEQHTNIIA